MKSIPAFLFVAAFGALVAVVPLSFEIAVSLFFAASLAAIVACDYGCELRPRPAAAKKAGAPPRAERFGLAA